MYTLTEHFEIRVQKPPMAPNRPPLPSLSIRHLARGMCIYLPMDIVSLFFPKKDICEYQYDANQCMDREAVPTILFCPVIGSLLPVSTLIGRYDQNGLTIIPLYENRGIYALPFQMRNLEIKNAFFNNESKKKEEKK